MASFWTRLIDSMTQDDDGADSVNGKRTEYTGHTLQLSDDTIEKSNKREWLAFSARETHINNLPTEAILETSNSICKTCGTIGVLGNGVCVDCWDYVVANSSASAKNWPNARQYGAIKLAHS